MATGNRGDRGRDRLRDVSGVRLRASVRGWATAVAGNVPEKVASPDAMLNPGSFEFFVHYAEAMPKAS